MHHYSSVCPSVTGNLEVIRQGLALFEKVSNDDYNHKAAPLVTSSMGEHLRHILDMYLALESADQVGVVDYDHRRRGASVESELSEGISELQAVERWLTGLDQASLDRPLTILSEASVSSRQICEVTSTLRRELLFVASHTVHHFALVRVVAIHLDLTTGDDFGFAPATATYLRSQNDLKE